MRESSASVKSEKPGIKQFRSEKSLSYVFFDRGEKLAVIINPTQSLMGDYRSYLAQNRLVLSWVVVTLAGAGREHALDFFPEETRVGPELCDHLSVGSLKLAPLRVDSEGKSWVGLYSNDILFLNDLSFIRSAHNSALSESFRKLSPKTVIYPASDESGLIFSILENEFLGRAFPITHQRFIEMGIEKYKSKLSEAASDSLFIDVREESEYLAGHMPNTQNFPSSEIGLRWEELTRSKKVYVSCTSGERSLQVVRTLNYLGLSHVIHIKAGFRGWVNAGLPIDKAF